MATSRAPVFRSLVFRSVGMERRVLPGPAQHERTREDAALRTYRQRFSQGVTCPPSVNLPSTTDASPVCRFLFEMTRIRLSPDLAFRCCRWASEVNSMTYSISPPAVLLTALSRLE